MIVSVLLGAMVSFSTTAQVVVKVKPRRPALVIAKPTKAKRGHRWVDGHWQWNAKCACYKWKKGHWIRTRPGRTYVGGHWVVVKGGHKWVPGRWS